MHAGQVPQTARPPPELNHGRTSAPAAALALVAPRKLTVPWLPSNWWR